MKKLKKTHVRTTFGSCDVEKVHDVVARSTFPTQNVQNTPAPDHVWKLRCRKSARRCGAKHISNSKCTKHHFRTTSGNCDVEKVHAVVARSTFRSQHLKKTTCSDLFGRLFDVQMSFCVAGARKCALVKSEQNVRGFVAFSTTTTTTPHYTPIRYTTTTTTPSLHSTTLHYTTLHYTTLHSTTLNYTKLHYTTLQYIPLRSTNYTQLHYIALHYTTFHYTTLTTTTTTTTTILHLHYATLHYTHYTTLHSTTPHYTEWRCTTPTTATATATTLHYIALH